MLRVEAIPVVLSLIVLTRILSVALCESKPCLYFIKTDSSIHRFIYLLASYSTCKLHLDSNRSSLAHIAPLSSKQNLKQNLKQMQMQPVFASSGGEPLLLLPPRPGCETGPVCTCGQ